MRAPAPLADTCAAAIDGRSHEIPQEECPGEALETTRIDNPTEIHTPMPNEFTRLIDEAKADRPRANSTHQRLIALADDAAKKQPYEARIAAGNIEPHAYVKVPTEASAVLGLLSDTLPELFNADGTLTRAPYAAPGAVTLRLDAAIAAASRVVQAGTNLIFHDDTGMADRVGREGVVTLQRRYSEFRCVEAGQFSNPADDAQLPVTELNVRAARIDWSQSTSLGLQVTVDRAEQSRIGAGNLLAEIMISVVHGIARAVDRVLLAEIASTTPAAFSLALAAARGLTFEELRALVGTAGTGAAVGQDGQLRAAGIAAELTGDAAATIIGAFNRSAVAVHADMPLHIERKNKSGDLIVTAWVQLEPLVPAGVGAFWVAAT